MATRVQIDADDFNRADGGLGSNWTESHQTGTGDIVILTNQIKSAGASGNKSSWYYNPTSPPADQYAQLRIVTRDNGAGFEAPCVRMSESQRTFYAYRMSGANALQVVKIVNDVQTLLGAGPTGASGQTLVVEAEGTTIRGFRSTTLDVTVTDSAIASGRYGMGIIFETADAFRGDDWAAGNMVGEGGSGGWMNRIRNFINKR